MFSNLTIGIVLGLAAGGWVYVKIQRYTGGNKQSSATVAIVCGALVALISTTLLSMLF